MQQCAGQRFTSGSEGARVGKEAWVVGSADFYGGSTPSVTVSVQSTG